MERWRLLPGMSSAAAAAVERRRQLGLACSMAVANGATASSPNCACPGQLPNSCSLVLIASSVVTSRCPALACSSAAVGAPAPACASRPAPTARACGRRSTPAAPAAPRRSARRVQVLPSPPPAPRWPGRPALELAGATAGWRRSTAAYPLAAPIAAAAQSEARSPGSIAVAATPPPRRFVSPCVLVGGHRVLPRLARWTPNTRCPGVPCRRAPPSADPGRRGLAGEVLHVDHRTASACPSRAASPGTAIPSSAARGQRPSSLGDLEDAAAAARRRAPAAPAPVPARSATIKITGLSTARLSTHSLQLSDGIPQSGAISLFCHLQSYNSRRRNNKSGPGPFRGHQGRSG